MKNLLHSFVLLLLAIGVTNSTCYASHIGNGAISYTHLSGNEYILQVIRTRDCDAISAPLSFRVDYSSSCDTGFIILPNVGATDITPLCADWANLSSCTSMAPNSINGYHRVTYRDTITLPSACSDWRFSTTTCCRYPTYVNIIANLSAAAFLETTLNNVIVPNNNSPTFASGEVDFLIAGQPYIYHQQAQDSDGDELRFRLTDALISTGTSATYVAGLSGNNPLPFSFTLDSLTGNLNVTATATGIYIICFSVEEYRNGVLIATTLREISLFVFSSNLANNNSYPQANISNVLGGVLHNNTLYTQVNQQISFDITITDFDGDSVVWNNYDIAAGFPGSSSSSGDGFVPISSSFSWMAPANGTYKSSYIYRDFLCPFHASHFELPITIQVGAFPTFNTSNHFVGADSSLTLCGNLLGQLTNISSGTILQGPIYGSASPPGVGSSCFSYVAPSSGDILDSVWLELCDNTGACDTTLFIIEVGTCVWAGDTDTNKVVNNFDLLPIGLSYNQTGPLRPNADLLLDCEPASNWVNSTPVTNINYKHSDCNGSGNINAADTAAIIQNWSLTYNRNSSSTSSTQGAPLYVDYAQANEGDTIQLPIIFGDSSHPVDSVYGIAFTINYDQNMVDSGSVAVKFSSSSWFGFLSFEILEISKDFYPVGQIQVAATRFDHQDRSGLGQIGTLQLTIKDDIIKKSSNTRLNISVSDVRAIDAQEVALGVSTPPTYVVVLDSGTVLTTTPDVDWSQQIELFPNPANDQLWLRSAQTIVGQIEIISLTGQVLEQLYPTTQQLSISTADLPNGIYIAKITTNKGSICKRFVVYH